VARFLIATQPITGHVLPALPLARELARRGHETGWYCGKKFGDAIEATGARFVPYDAAYDYDDSDYDAAFTGRAEVSNLGQIRFDFVNLFVNQLAPQHWDINRVLTRFPADAVVADPSVGPASTINERGGPPFAFYNVSCLGLRSRDIGPFGLGLMPSGNRSAGCATAYSTLSRRM
jgi:UDP:flavonoid glycosyltransferase YjiC (YdhE family)